MKYRTDKYGRATPKGRQEKIELLKQIFAGKKPISSLGQRRQLICFRDCLTGVADRWLVDGDEVSQEEFERIKAEHTEKYGYIKPIVFS